MTAALASVGPIGWAAIVAGSLCLYGAFGIAVGRFCCTSDPGEDEAETVVAQYPPPVPPLPAPMDDDGWDEWVRVWPADTALEVMEQAVFDRLFADIPEVAADLRDHA